MSWLREAGGPAKEMPIERILVVSTTALGDTLWATPAIASLRSSFPNAYLGALTSPVGKEILKYNPHIDQLYSIKEPLLPRFFSLRTTLLQDRFDTILIFHTSQRLTLPLCALLGASRIVGTVGINKGLDHLLTHPLPNIRQHEISRRLQIVASIGGKASTETISFFLQPEEMAPTRTGRWIALHPGSKDRFKRWPVDHFAVVGKALQQKLHGQILITGTKEEWPLMKELAAKIPGAYLSNPHWPLRKFAAELAQMDLLISNDTGPFHLACALNRPAIALYAATDPALCGPYLAPKGRAIGKPPSCTPCLKKRCPIPFCLLQIGPSEVVDAAIELIGS